MKSRSHHRHNIFLEDVYHFVWRYCAMQFCFFGCCYNCYVIFHRHRRHLLLKNKWAVAWLDLARYFFRRSHEGASSIANLFHACLTMYKSIIMNYEHNLYLFMYIYRWWRRFGWSGVHTSRTIFFTCVLNLHYSTHKKKSPFKSVIIFWQCQIL